MYQFIIPWTKLDDHNQLGDQAIVQGEIRVMATDHLDAMTSVFPSLHPDKWPVTYWASLEYSLDRDLVI